MNIKQIPIWLSWGLWELQKNIKEYPGKETHPRILEYHKHTGLLATDDEVAWCSAAMNCAMVECGLSGTNSAAARSWLGWGDTLKEFQLGCIVVLWREKRSSWKGHVGIGLTQDDSMVTILGGNQGNSFSIQRHPKVQILSYRWPKDYETK